jgi:hypothetical protein
MTIFRDRLWISGSGFAADEKMPAGAGLTPPKTRLFCFLTELFQNRTSSSPGMPRSM